MKHLYKEDGHYDQEILQEPIIEEAEQEIRAAIMKVINAGYHPREVAHYYSQSVEQRVIEYMLLHR